VTADDVLAVVAAAVAALRPGAGGDWSAPAGDLTWTCWETAEHLADDLFCYAAQLGADGPSDPEASAAMGVLETLVHTYDVTRGLCTSWTPDATVCTRVLARLMPEVERTEDAWADLLWACGRIALPGRPRREQWRWHNTSPRQALPGLSTA
jgi:hypothetical protein